MTRIILKGYYGFGNLGDDILCMVICRFLKKALPDCLLYVATASKAGGYLHELSKGQIEEVLPLSPEPQADIVIHGGGGTYYDYTRGNLLYSILNFIISRIDRKLFIDILGFYRKLKGWPENKDTVRAAVGIGVGSFTKSSRKYYQKITELASFKMIMVRDQESFKRLEDLDLPGSLIMGADLAFFSSYWMTSSDSFSKSRLRIGFVIKYMEIQEGYLDVIRQAAFTFQNEGIEVVIFSFEKNHDHMLAQFFHEFKIIWWSPSTLTVDEYMEEFSDCSLLVTSRAHGAILGAAFGIPSICIGIEPKLKQVSKMFPNSGMYVSLPLTFDMLYDKIKVGMTIAYDRVIMDFELNKAKLDKSISEFRQFLYSYCKSDET